MNINQLSGDSSVHDVQYQNGIIQFVYSDYDSDEDYQIKIPSSRFISDVQSELGTVQIRLNELTSVLEIDEKSKMYILPNNFGKQMKASKDGYHLAVGLNSQEYKFLLRVSGYNLLLATPIKSDLDIEIKKQD
jgi:hypothetical protein